MPEFFSESDLSRQSRGQHGVRLFGHVMACVDRSAHAARVLEEAVSLANLTGADLTIMRVMPGGSSSTPHADPVDWELTRREETADLLQMAKTAGATADIHTVVTCGPAPRCVRDEALRRGVDLLVVGAGAFGTPHRWGIGGTARHLAETFRGSILIVPDDVAGEQPRTSRVIVPMDGSPHAEAALRYACEIARRRATELVVLHAVPDISSLRQGRTGLDDEPLWHELGREAEQRAKELLRRLRLLLPVEQTGNRIRQLSGDDPRRVLMKAICEEQGGLVVLSARGLGKDPDLPIGSTAEYLLSRAVTPVLLIRNAEMTSHHTGGTAPRRPAAPRQDQ